MTSVPLLTVRGLRVDYTTPKGTNAALRGIDLDVDRGEVVAVVGESGSGKSTIAHALVRLLPEEATIAGGDIRFDDVDVMSLSQRALRRVRGARIGFVPQDPSHSLNPVLRIGEQIAEVVRRHLGLTPPRERSRSSTRSGFPSLRGAPGSILTNSPAACVSACSSASRGRAIRSS